jgi:opine dehydrogenase
MLGNAGWIEKTAGDFLWYHEGITPAIGKWIDAVDGERLAIVRALGLAPLRFVDIFYQAGLTTLTGRDSGSAYQAIHESEPNRTIKSPASLDHRYIREDIGYGLVPMAEIGRLLGIKTPVMDGLIQLASTALGVDFRDQGLTLARMGLADVSAERLGTILHDGF